MTVNRLAFFLFPLLAVPLGPGLLAQGTGKADRDHDGGSAALTSATVSGLKLRNIGPAVTSGRLTDIAVDPVRRSTWYVAAASGNVWKTVNAGTTWKPIFDKQGSYSIGSVAVDPRHHLTVWVGTGENNSQRSVAFGDGLYKSIDGGASFRKVGLERSEHIAKILIDPRNSDVVYVAAQGPLWAAGGDRGLYKSTDGGETWKRVLTIDDDTGVTDVHFDPRDPDVLYAASYQRRRHVWTLIDGGPGSGVWKSTDAGATWRRIDKGLPSGDKGRIGLAISPIRPDIVYAIVEATGDKGGFFRSEDGGEHWSRQSEYVSSSPQYYQEIVADPHRFDRVYSLDTFVMVTEDGGKHFSRLGETDKHVDNHALIIDPADAHHLIVGCDGGLYETWDRGKSWDFKANLPVTQFYKVAVDNDVPFYHVYGGTQDNNTLGGPSRTANRHGIRNSDWFVTVGGDGFGPEVDPEDPNIIYSQWQYGNLIRYDRRTGERIDIKPREEAQGPPLRWNWDSGLMISPHSHTRLYFGAQMLFRSDDRGDSWRAVSPDLTRQVDRNRLKIMGRVWSVDAVAKNRSTSVYGTIVSLSESPLVEDLLYVGTDDGWIQVSEDGGTHWRRVEHLPGVPDTSYVNDLEASRTDPNTVYAVLNNHKRGDFKPYVLRSTDRGRTWRSIAGDLPERGPAYTIVQDEEQPDLLFVGTEYGIFFTVDGGKKWVQLKGGMPTIAIRELEIQRREHDLVAASFGRGFFILDDYTPLRQLSEAALQEEARIFPVKKAWMYVPASPLGGGGKASQGTSFFTAPNPPFGATFTYYLKESRETRKARRHKKESELEKKGADVFYPPWEELKAEDREERPLVFLTVRDEAGQVVRRIKGSTSRGIHRATWDFRYPGFTPISRKEDGFGPLAVPGRYTVSLSELVESGIHELVPPAPFEVEPLGAPSLPPADRRALLAFEKQTGALQRAVMGASRAAQETAERLELIKRAIEVTPTVDIELRKEARALELRLMDLREALRGDPTRSRRSEPAMPGILARVQQIVRGHWSSTSAPTRTHRRLYEIASQEFTDVSEGLRQLIEVDLPALEGRLDAAGVPWTPGRRVPRWPPR
ncbi:MAG: glycosyl hydrolase [Gemmatimonadota bacterium]